MQLTTQVGNKLDHYAIESLVADTNTASIFRGVDLHTGRPVAIKIPHPEVEADVRFFERFLREQEICEKLDHPAVVKACTDNKRSRVYMVTEWVQGRLLRQIISEQGKLPSERAVKIALRICEALEYIHHQGIVHRDLKPENIIIDAEDRIKLIDFGIAGKAGARRLTFGKLSQVMGTPDYISPEQVKGKRGDARSDLYALGVILYEMLTGKTPFLGDNPLVIMNSRLVNHPVPPREADPGVSLELQEIIYRALERDPKKRYPSAREFSWDLQHQEQLGVVDHPELRDWSLQSWARPRTGLLYGALAMIPVFLFMLMLYAARRG